MNNTLKTLCEKNNLPCIKLLWGCVSQLIELQSVACQDMEFFQSVQNNNNNNPPLIPTLSQSLLASKKGHTSYGEAFVSDTNLVSEAERTN